MEIRVFDQWRTVGNPYRVHNWWKLWTPFVIPDEALAEKMRQSFCEKMGYEPDYVICMKDIKTLVVGPVKKHLRRGKKCSATSVDERMGESGGDSL